MASWLGRSTLTTFTTFTTLALAALGALVAPARAGAQEMDVPVETQIPLFLKVATFDRQLHARVHGDLVIAVAFQSGNRASTAARDDALRALSAAGPTVDDLPIRITTIDLDRETLASALVERQVAMLYITPMRSVDIGALASAARAASVLTFTGVERYVAQGVSVGVRLRQDRPLIVVNLREARMEGVSFSAELLKLVEIL